MHPQTITALKLMHAFDADAYEIAEATRNTPKERYTDKNIMPYPAFISDQARKHTVQEYIDLHMLKCDMDATLLNQ